MSSTVKHAVVGKVSPAGFFKMLLTAAAVVSVFYFSILNAHSAQADLAWDPPLTATGAPVANLSSYNVYLGTAPGTYSQKVNVGDQTSYSFTNLAEGITYYFAATALDSSGNESSFSNEGSKTIPALAPDNTGGSNASIIPQTNWRLIYVDSQEVTGENGAATNAFDDRTGSFWHTKWSNGSPIPPHEIQIDLGQTYEIGSFSYLPRQDGMTNGRIAGYEFYVSNGTDWGTPVAKGTFVNDGALKSVSFAAKTGRYIRLRAMSEVSGNPWTCVAELNVSGNSAAVSSHLITATAGAGGSISPAATSTVNSGGSQAYTITPNTGYRVTDVKVDGFSIGAVTSYTFTNVTANRTIQASFAAIKGNRLRKN